MRRSRPGIAIRLARWLRIYLVVALLAAVAAWTFASSLTGTLPPTPEFPPLGYAVEQDSVQLQWSPGSRCEGARVEVVADAPRFDRPRFYDKVVRGAVTSLVNLEQGRTYYWRVSCGDRTSRIGRFSVTRDALRY
jgi:hypothetical protein